MAKSSGKKLKTHLIFSITLIISLIAIVATATFSWFVNRDDNYLSQIRVETIDTFNLKVVTNEETGNGFTSNIHDDFFLKPVFGNGIDFFVPEYERQEVVEGSGVYDDLPNGEYLSINEEVENYVFLLDFFLFIDRPAELYLEYTSNERTYVKKGNFSENRKSPYGDFSKDNIIGAIRVAIIVDNVLEMIWIPNSTIQLKNNPDGTFEVLDDGEVEESYTFMNGDKSTFSISTGGVSNGNTEVDGVTYVWGEINIDNCPKVIDIFKEKKFNVVTWIDGNDRECTNALVGGKMNMNLCFSAKQDD